MKFDKAKVAKSALALFIALAATPALALAQQPAKNDKSKHTRQRTTQAPAQKPTERMEPDDPTSPARTDVPAETQAARHESASDDAAALVPYYNNFLSTYRLGPEDVISITVFGSVYLERYSKSNIVIPPNAVITHPLIPEGIFVGGKTTQQVRDEIVKKFDEYVENPKVDVTLEKAQSAVFWVMGDVGQPGIRPMARRLSVTEALALSGGVLDTGDKSHIIVNRRLPNGYMQQSIINVSAIERGKQPDNFFLNPGDQVLVPGTRMKQVEKWIRMVSGLTFLRVFTGGF
ncbi:MAG: polysaccharide biosynthesis/export protein [Acidobacteriota bacterium]|nr:polysaccharide biosynthesis/export protein [Acidobacteriota bacterium]